MINPKRRKYPCRILGTNWPSECWPGIGLRLTRRSLCFGPDEELLELLAAAYRVRRRYFGNRVELYFLMNAKSGLCPEDCGYCSQSKVSEAEIPRYNLLSEPKLLDGARDWPPSAGPRPIAS